VGPELSARFQRRYGAGLTHEGRLDLWSAAERALAEVGVGPACVVNPRLCTSCNPDLFFSHRRDGSRTGRQGLLAWVEREA
jgi:copper oxidase (laccase) domain-containing protein